ncbi:hypothetical protein GGR02_003253 [Anoxybacillus voinovskiensis]|uniref:Peptidase M17 leucyl aminopeptidase N-terminal domain-containing protein n=1 Tax=Anoxybacteroides voinovskiense TaxID=230470 RepID=A0A840E0Y9_9BACL|nr:hypothetical protein [Anoxybacillus voinovskiensis]GGJ78574.1 hypothetical protein GCM10008982_29920 [Anoxybacillus voinovskiensis]
MFTVMQEISNNARHEAIVIGLFEKEPLFSGIVAKWNEQLNGQLTELVNEGDLSPKKKHITKVHTLGQMNIKRLYFVGLGKKRRINV